MLLFFFSTKAKTFPGTLLTPPARKLMFVTHWPDVGHIMTMSCKVVWKDVNRIVLPILTNHDVLPGAGRCYRGKTGD